MNLTLGIIMDEFAKYKPVALKMGDTTAQIRQFHYHTANLAEFVPECLYVGSTEIAAKALDKNCPKHIIISGDTIPSSLPEKTDTLIQIPGGVCAEEILQAGHTLFASHEAWHNSLLLAVIEHKPLKYFLDLAAQKTVNPFALFDNNMAVIGVAGSFLRSAKGTIWEKIDNPQFVSGSFFTVREQRNLASLAAKKNGQPYIYHPSADRDHAYLTSHIWINDNLYGSIGMVDINTPFTEGQVEIIRRITYALKLYFQHNHIYMRIAENNINYLNSLLGGVDIHKEIVVYYLNKMGWRINDNYRCFTFLCPLDFATPIEPIPYVKQISGLFPKALVSVYQNSIVMIARCADHTALTGVEKQRLDQLLKKTEMRCGASMTFGNFMRLHYYYTQSNFAATQCNPPSGPAFCLYEDCQTEHILSALAAGADLRCFCHPGILSLWESGDEAQQELIRCLYHYFLNGRNISATADAVHVHRNTLIYRLGKAEEILNIDIKQSGPEQALLYLISCLIVQHL
jgi:hypothetical protein